MGEVTRVLVADSDEPTRNLVHLTFHGPTWSVVGAHSTDELVRALASSVPDVLVIDADLPQAGGLATTRALRGHPRTAEVRVLLVADLSRPVAADDLAAAEVDAVIERPFGAFELYEAVEELLQRT